MCNKLTTEIPDAPFFLKQSTPPIVSLHVVCMLPRSMRSCVKGSIRRRRGIFRSQVACTQFPSLLVDQHLNELEAVSECVIRLRTVLPLFLQLCAVVMFSCSSPHRTRSSLLAVHICVWLSAPWRRTFKYCRAKRNRANITRTESVNIGVIEFPPRTFACGICTTFECVCISIFVSGYSLRMSSDGFVLAFAAHRDDGRPPPSEVCD